ncbi:hypothetical protein, unlikely [Trypanosoma brucei brucei TREU927]|uniref:Uncharacterized protein n=1 Tax=Trypanosoma brucei brucei (strain 927/4 GUTat10.1) TaxID=185431 RepID=Q4GZF7_TRYB2|nr:hypothetical protein, unlikely [Trypanosoma brucei brucei TREU927]CAJ15959.1 hypothetical protein, unlikely [Trypanosoma brucei brucei TREU927]
MKLKSERKGEKRGVEGGRPLLVTSAFTFFFLTTRACTRRGDIKKKREEGKGKGIPRGLVCCQSLIPLAVLHDGFTSAETPPFGAPALPPEQNKRACIVAGLFFFF